MSIAVTTRGYGFDRAGSNTHETTLTAQAVGTRGIKQLFRLETPDDKRGCEASPLIATAVKMPNGEVHDVVFLSTMGNWVYAFDADHGALLWKRQVGRPITGTTAIDSHNINDHWGIVSTPVVHDGVLYGCAWISHGGGADQAKHFVFALRISDGQDQHAMLSLEAVRFAPGHGLPELAFSAGERKQRAALSITKGALIVPFGTVRETANDAHGWVIAVDLASWTVTANWCTTARGSGAGIWMAGAGPAILPDGDIVFATGNGAFDGVTDFGESIVRLRYTPRQGGHPAHLGIVDWWTPWTDEGRTGGNAHLLDLPDATNFRPLHHFASMGALRTGQPSGEWADMDLGSGAVVPCPSLGLLACAGKDGVLYAPKMDGMGKTTPPELTPATNHANYAKLAFRPIFFTYFPPELDPAPVQISTLNVLHDGQSHHLHGAPVFFDSAEFGPMLFGWGENENGRAWQLKRDSCNFLARTAESASPQASLQFAGGMPGGMISVSSNGAQRDSAILWACVPYGDANRTLSAGRLLAYAATRFVNGELVKLWDSQDWNHQFTHNKFGVPVVANGKVYLPTYDGAVIVYGLA